VDCVQTASPALICSSVYWRECAVPVPQICKAKSSSLPFLSLQVDCVQTACLALISSSVYWRECPVPLPQICKVVVLSSLLLSLQVDCVQTARLALICGSVYWHECPVHLPQIYAKWFHYHHYSCLCRWIVCRQHALRSSAAVYTGVNALYLYPRYAKWFYYHYHSCLCRWIVCRQRALRSFAAVYIGVNALYLYPRYAKEAFSSAWPWLLRYSNAWVLLMTAVGLMVSACASPFVQLLSASAEVCWLLSAKLCSPNCALPIVSQLPALPIVSSAAHLLEIWCRHCCSCQYQHHDRLIFGPVLGNVFVPADYEF